MAQECVKREDAIILPSTTCFRLSPGFWHCGRAVILGDPPYEALCQLDGLLTRYPTVAYITICFNRCVFVAIKRQRVAGWRATAYVDSKKEALIARNFLRMFCNKVYISPARGSLFIEARGECVRRIAEQYGLVSESFSSTSCLLPANRFEDFDELLHFSSVKGLALVVAVRVAEAEFF